MMLYSVITIMNSIIKYFVIMMSLPSWLKLEQRTGPLCDVTYPNSCL